MTGYWEPHTSSVDFCEPNYEASPYFAEFHNVWSSLIITFFGIFGFLYSNPTKDASVGAMYFILAVVGLGSVGLHTTLHWLLQSSDEVPMLWQILSFLHVLYICKQKEIEKIDMIKIGIAFFSLAFVQTVLYYTFQQIYAVFIGSMIVYVIILLVVTHSFLENETDKALKSAQIKLHLWAFLYFVVFGVGVWMVDMHGCHVLMPYYLQINGFTLHVFWHIFAGLGSYCLCALLTFLRIRQLKLRPRVRWFAYFLPYCEIETSKSI